LIDLGHHFQRYAQLQIGRKAASSLKQETWKQHQFWRFLESIHFEGHELEVERSHLQAYLEHLEQRGLKSGSIRSAISLLSPFYEDAIKGELILHSPFLGLKLPKVKIEPCKVLSVEQMKRLLETPDLSTMVGLRDRAILELMYSTGLRRAEVGSLKLEDFAEDYRSLRVMGKGSKEAVLPVGKIAAHFVLFYAEHVWGDFNRRGCSELFLSTFKRGPLCEYQVYRIVRDAALKAGIVQKISPHVFRYSIATHFDEAGVDVRYIQEFLRHEDLSTTSRYIQQSFHRLQTVHRQTHPNNS
jgi:integrase/recombinase XerD